MKRFLCICLAFLMVLGALAPMGLAVESETEIVPVITNTSALDRGGTAWVWRQDFDNFDNPWLPPVQVPNLDNAVSLIDNAVLKADGTVWTWHWDWAGDNRIITTPTRISNLDNITAIAQGTALKEDGTVWVWDPTVREDGDLAVQIPNLTDITAIASASYTGGTALGDDGTVWAWSWAWDSSGAITAPDPVQIQNLNNVRAITQGAVLRNNGTVWAWCVDPREPNTFVPRQVSNLSNVTAIDFGTALLNDGTVWQFRTGKMLGCPHTTAVQIPNVSNISMIGNSTALRHDDYVWFWNPVAIFHEDDTSFDLFDPTPVRLVRGLGGIWFLNLSGAVTPLSFTDVTPANWFYPYTRHVVDNNIMQGTSPTTFAPSTNFSRAQVVATLYRMVHGGTAREMPYANNRPIFNDVEVNAWYSHYVAWAFDNGVVTGISETNFAPNNHVTREQFATMLHRFATFREYDDDVNTGTQWNNFADIYQVSSWATDALTWANYNGLITGRTYTTIVPSGTAMRSEASAILTRFMQTFDS